MEPRALCMENKHSTTELYTLSPFEAGSHRSPTSASQVLEWKVDTTITWQGLFITCSLCSVFIVGLSFETIRSPHDNDTETYY